MSGKKSKKMMLFGLDGAIPEYLMKLAEKGLLPNIKRLIDNGVFYDIWPILPPNTANGWATIATGATPGTHGITDMNIHQLGWPLDKLETGFNSQKCQAEYLWNAAARAGKSSILMKYIGSWPPSVKKGIQIDGCGIPSINGNVNELFPPHAFTTQLEDVRKDRYILPLEVMPAKEWKNIPTTFRGPFKELKVTLRKGVFRNIYRIGTVRYLDGELPQTFLCREKSYYALLTSSNSVIFDKMILAKERNYESRVATLSQGEWSDWFLDEFDSDKGKVEGFVRVKLTGLSKDGGSVHMCFSQVMPKEGYAYPPGVAEELTMNVGPFLEHTVIDFTDLKCGGIETTLEEERYQHDWFARATLYLMENYDWDLFFMQTQLTDHFEHRFLHVPEEEEYLIAGYQMVDEMIGKISAKADDDTLVIVVSDHGQVAAGRSIFINNALQKAGLLSVYKEEENGLVKVDWTRTKAVAQRECMIYVNTKGRDPQGIVELGEEYEKVRDKIISVLRAIKKPNTDSSPIALALRKEDAGLLGLTGDRVGDIVYATRDGFHGAPRLMTGQIENLPIFQIRDPPRRGNHGTEIATNKDYGSTAGVLIMKGPGIRKGVVLKSSAWLWDVAPTTSYLMDIPFPKNCEGKILLSALELNNG